MQIQVFTCPYCGARLEYDGINARVQCEYCDSNIIIDRDVQNVLRQPSPPASTPSSPSNVEQEKMKFKALQSQRREILARWDAEEAKEEAEVAKAKKILIHVCGYV